jgi:hypothetical protein
MARIETRRAEIAPAIIPVIAFGLSLSIFLAISYVLCILFYLLFPASAERHVVFSLFLPWLEILTWPGFLLGLVASVACGWYVALVFGPLYNFFASQRW